LDSASATKAAAKACRCGRRAVHCAPAAAPPALCFFQHDAHALVAQRLGFFLGVPRRARGQVVPHLIGQAQGRAGQGRQGLHRGAGRRLWGPNLGQGCHRLRDHSVYRAAVEAAEILETHVQAAAKANPGGQAETGVHGVADACRAPREVDHAADDANRGVSHRRGGHVELKAAAQLHFLQHHQQQLQRQARSGGVSTCQANKVANAQAQSDIEAGSGLGHGLGTEGQTRLVEQIQGQLELRLCLRLRKGLATRRGGNELCKAGVRFSQCVQTNAQPQATADVCLRLELQRRACTGCGPVVACLGARSQQGPREVNSSHG
jgi:hypothetical protein